MSHSRLASLMRLPLLASLILSMLALPSQQVAQASHTPAPASVNLVGSLESEASGGACGDWDPACVGSRFGAQGNDVYLYSSASIPAGSWEYKVALGSWAENYGSNFLQDGPNIGLTLAGDRAVEFYYDHKTHWIADNVRNAGAIFTAPGSFNSEVGCGADWQPECLATLLTDVDGDGVFSTTFASLPAGSYEFKIAADRGWNVNYGAGGTPGGNNMPLVIGSPSRVTISFNSLTKQTSLQIKALGPSIDGNVEWDGLRHDSRDTLYRSPGGAVPAGTPVQIRFRTFHNDVTSVRLRLYDLNANGQRLVTMTPAATDVPCFQAGMEASSCDYWQATVESPEPNNLWYRFIVSDGGDTDYYGDNTSALDGGLGATSDEVVDQSYALMFHVPSFSSPAWAKDAVIYQIFPDRFRNGRKSNDPKTGDVRYDDPVIKLQWGTLPEGYCRNYADGNTNCPWRFDDTPPDWSPTKEGPRGRDYMGGDLKGVDQQLDYLKSLGVNTIYFNPIFDAGSNHSYDTQDYYKIDPYFGTQKDWENLVKHARERGIRIVLDGVFNHMSSDSPLFDRYGHYPQVGACESLSSPYRSWFVFRDVPAGTGTCVGAAGANSATYEGWFGFDSIPVLNKSNPAVQQYFLTGSKSVSRTWLKAGAAGWRMDVSGDPSFPNGYWETFRSVTKGTSPDALLISETWQKDSTLLRMLRGDRLDTTMNYRLRDAVLGLLAPQSFDSKGFGDSGRVISPSEFASRLASVREDYPDAAFYSLMNLLDSHDTERLRWTLTPGAETAADREQNAANVAEGKRRLQIASLIQFAMPGAPTIYYGDEVGLTGDDDPDDRRTFPWADQGGSPDRELLSHYSELAAIRKNLDVLRNGDLRILMADDSAGTVAIGRRNGHSAAALLINRSAAPQTLRVPVAGFAPEGATFDILYCVANDRYEPLRVQGGAIEVTLAPLSAMLLGTLVQYDMVAPAAPGGLAVTSEGAGQVSLSWGAIADAAGYNVYRSVVSGGGYVKVNAAPVASTIFTDSGLRNGDDFYYVVKAVDAVGNESDASAEVRGTPRYIIGWANLQWPPSMTYTIVAGTSTDTAYGQVWIDGVTSQPGQTASLRAQLGYGPQGSSPASGGWTWVDASFNTNAGNNDEFMAQLQPELPGAYDYVYRYSTDRGRSWLYADLGGPIAAGAAPANPGRLTVIANADTTPPAAPSGLQVLGSSPAAIDLGWDAVAGDTSLYGYEVLRSGSAGGPYALVARVAGATSFRDTTVSEGATYFYVVRAIDIALNRSGNSNEVQATAAPRTVTLVINLSVPATTDGTGRSVYIAGFLDRLNGGLPQWNPGGVVLTRVSATQWTITFTGLETTEIEYKYALGSWDFVEKGASCDELANRRLTLAYGATGTQVVNDSVLNWRNVAPCGN